MELRLVEQACSCVKVRGVAECNVRGRLLTLALGWRVPLAAATMHLQAFAFVMEPPWSSDWLRKLAAASRWCEAKVDSSCVIIFCLWHSGG